MAGPPLRPRRSRTVEKVRPEDRRRTLASAQLVKLDRGESSPRPWRSTSNNTLPSTAWSGLPNEAPSSVGDPSTGAGAKPSPTPLVSPACHTTSATPTPPGSSPPESIPRPSRPVSDTPPSKSPWTATATSWKASTAEPRTVSTNSPAPGAAQERPKPKTIRAQKSRNPR